jgi:hypothetical protein
VESTLKLKLQDQAFTPDREAFEAFLCAKNNARASGFIFSGGTVPHLNSGFWLFYRGDVPKDHS